MLDLIRAGHIAEAKERLAGVSVVVIGLNHRTVPLDLLERMTIERRPPGQGPRTTCAAAST